MTPLIYGPDGILRSTAWFTTTLSSRFFEGTCPENTVSLEVSIRGAAFTSDSNIVYFDGTSFLVPNPAVYPDGLELQPGVNTLQFRAVLASGSITPYASVTTKLVRNVEALTNPPTNVTIEQGSDSVIIAAEGVSDTNFVGINVYASVYGGGGVTGYSRINAHTISTPSTKEEVTEITSFDAEADVTATAITYTGTQDTVEFTETVTLPPAIDRVRSTISVSSIRIVNLYTFEHNRNANLKSSPATITNNQFAGVATTEPLFYVVTGVYYDPAKQIEMESHYSVEVVGHPLTLINAVGNFPLVTRRQIRDNTTEAIMRSNPQIKIEPGSYLRDVFIDPFSSEAERLRFVVDFYRRCISFDALLQIDDPNNTHASIAVSASSYKTALKSAFGLQKDSDAQALIDRAFETLAANVGVQRQGARVARGEVTFYTSKRPTSTVNISTGTIVGAGTTTFRVTQGKQIPLNNQTPYFNPSDADKRYSITVAVQAVKAGTSGNLAKGQIRRVVSGVTGMSVINQGNMFGGTDQETNYELAIRSKNAIASVDTGTKQGYYQIAAGVPGVKQVNVAGAGDPLMLRGASGKVDIWIQGTNEATVEDTFAFGYDTVQKIQFVIVGDPSDLLFRAIDPMLTADTPIIQLLDDVVAGYGFKNATTGLLFDVTGCTFPSYNMVQLVGTGVQPAVTLTDVILGDYRRRTTNSYVFPSQPVNSIVSVIGNISGAVTGTLYQSDAPLLLGHSIKAQSYLKLSGISNNSTLSVIGESHVLTGESVVSLAYLGVDPLTVVVVSEDRATTYVQGTDYLLQLGDMTHATGIVRVPEGSIRSGQSILVDYQYEENFTVTYKIDNMVRVCQNTVDQKKHLTADVLVKSAVAVPVDLEMTIVLLSGSNKSTVDLQLRSNIANYINGLGLSRPLRQSDVIGVVESTPGVSYVVVPLTRMARGDGSLVVWEELLNEASYLSLSTNTVSVWMLSQELSSSTVAGGGTDQDFHGVFQDGVQLELSQKVEKQSGRAYILGAEGLSDIPGLTDAATLAANGFSTVAQQEAETARLTGNRVLVSTSPSDSPLNHTYAVTYVVGQDTGVKNIDPSDAEYLTVGDLVLTYDEDL